MCAEARVAAFLLDLSRRFMRPGYSGSAFALRMTREEIGNYLDLKLETVSRIFSTLQKAGLLEVEQRRIVILDPRGLEGRIG
jgi:CRP/FNR family transcriptional regulator